MRYSITSAIVIYAAQVAAQDPYWGEYQFEIRDFNDLFDYDARGFEDSYDLASRDFDDGYGLVSRDINDDYTYAARSYDMDDSLHTRDISFVTAGFQPRDLFHSNIGNNWYRPTINPLASILSSPAHRDHSHLMFQGGHAFLVPPQHDPFESLFDSFLPSTTLQNSHNTVMAHASVSNSGNGYSCTSSTVIGMDGIPHTTKHCSNTTPDSHISITVGPSSDSDSDFFSDPFADLFTSTDSKSNWHDDMFEHFHTTPKLLRNKRILDLDATPHRGEIHSFSESDGEHTDHTDDHEEHFHDELHEKHDLRDSDGHEHDHDHEHGSDEKKEKRNPEAEANPEPAESTKLDVRNAKPEAAPEAKSDTKTLVNAK